jgi:hypothetical protein
MLNFPGKLQVLPKQDAPDGPSRTPRPLGPSRSQSRRAARGRSAKALHPRFQTEPAYKAA